MKLCGFEAGLDRPFFLIAGPCVVESEQLQLDVAGQLKDIAATLGIKIGTVRSRIHRGRSQLRATLAHRDPALLDTLA